ncbi:unnamed protein product [Prorocentrum cordatum]|uniref:RanBP2-type domain-containing protein n=1 Tax=Prorocentrum cordatum TaxID=2364126 RepID=A0ABN9XHU3_9DINO|nr:unnamed protein product [Polarella glacialis]
MVGHGQPAGGRSRGDVEGGGKAKGYWSYWVCSSRLCREWNWGSLWQCRSCGRVAPPWVKAAQPPAAAAGLEQPAADAEGFVVQPRGRKARRQAKRAAARAASAGAASLAGASEASSRQLSGVERHRQEVKRIEDFLAAPGESIDDACLQSLRAALDRGRRRLAAAEAAQADRRKADTPLPKALHGAGNALGKMARQGRAKEQALLKAEEAHAAAINEREEAVAREAACAEAVEECRAALEIHREEQKAAEARQAQEVGAAFAGTDLLGLVFGLIQQVEALPQGFAAGNGEAAFAEVAKQIAAVRRQAPPEPKGCSSWADTPVDVSDEDLGGDDEERTRASSVPSVQDAAERGRERGEERRMAHGPQPNRWPGALPTLERPSSTTSRWPRPLMALLLAAAGVLDVAAAGPCADSGRRAMRRLSGPHARSAPGCGGELRAADGRAAGERVAESLDGFSEAVVMGRIGNVGHRSVEVIEAFFHAHQSWPQLVLLRETRLTQERLLGARATARRLGYTAFLHETVATEQSGPNATSGGVAIQVRVGLQAEELGWPAGVRGQVLGPSEATCCAQGQERVFDWFFASSDLATCAASCTTTLSDFGLRPHSPVPPRLQDVRCVALVEVPSRPARLPEMEVLGMRPRDAALVQAFTFGKRGKVAQKEVTWSRAQGSRPIGLSAAFGEWIEAAEGTLSGIHVTATDDLPRFLGRAAWPKFRRMPFSALVLREALPGASDEKWRLWLQEGFSRRGGAHGLDVGSSTLPPITLEDLQQACRRFGPYVGSGCVFLLPRQLLLRPAALPLRWSDFLVAFEGEPSPFRGRWRLRLLFPSRRRDAARRAAPAGPAAGVSPEAPDHRCPLFWGRDGRGSECSLKHQQESRAAPWLQAWLDAHGLDEESLLSWAEEAVEAVSSAMTILDP